MLVLSLLFTALILPHRDADGQRFDVATLGDLNLDWLGNFSLPILNFTVACESLETANVTFACRQQLKIVCDNDTVMARMLDSWSKFPYPGALIATRLDYGNFDECIELDHSENGVRVLGKHCTGGLLLPTTPLNDSNFLEKAFKLSTCTPDACDTDDLFNLLNVPLFNQLVCNTKESWKSLGWDDIAVITFLLLIVTVMAVSTCYDLYWYFTEQKCPRPILSAFSVYRNGRKLLQTTKAGTKDQIMAFHGIKVISIMWIMSGHAFASFDFLSISFHDYARDWEWSRRSFYITTGHLAVDTFFFVSGFLFAYQYLKQEPKPLAAHLKQVPYLYFHRYIRITPALAVAFFTYNTVFEHMANGPIYAEGVREITEPCKKYWWSFFLYVQNYVNYKEICLVQTWYLSVDMQLFLIAPLVMIPVSLLVRRYYGRVIIQLLLLNIAFTVGPIALKMALGVFENEYETHGRLNVYFIGVMLAVFMKEKCDAKFKFSRTANFCIWLVVLLLMMICVLSFKETQLVMHFNRDLSVLVYHILLRAVWSVCLCWVVYSSHKGHGGIANWFLTRPVFQILSKLTYCIYITHIFVLFFIALQVRERVTFSVFLGVLLWTSSFCFSVLVAAFWSLAFESPLIVIEKYAFGHRTTN